MKSEERFCPICRAYHDPNFSCSDRAGGLLRAAGIEREPMDKRELQKTEKEADRTMLVILIVVIAVVVLFFFWHSLIR